MLRKNCRFLAVLILMTALLLAPAAGAAAETDPVPENHLRIHIQREDDSYQDLGLWVWEDVATWSEELGGWPDGSTWLADKPRTDFGVYVDVELAEDPEKVGFLLNNRQGENLTEDKFVEILAPEMNQVWLKQDGDDHNVYLYEPVDLPENRVRIHFYHEDLEPEDYQDWGLWIWDDVTTWSEEVAGWPEGATSFPEDQIGEFGAYLDIEVEEDPDQISFLAVNRETGEQTGDISIQDPDQDQYFFRWQEDEYYTNPYYVREAGMEAATLLADKIKIVFGSTAALTEEDLAEITVADNQNNPVAIAEVEVADEEIVEVRGAFDIAGAPYQVSFAEETATARANWRLIDVLYAYDGDLGVELHSDGSATLKLWSPRADQVSVILYDSEDQHEVVADDIPMTYDEKTGVWEVTLTEENTGAADLTGYFYHYQIEREGETRLGLDPYAPSLAAWEFGPEQEEPPYPVGQAAIVDPGEIGPELDYAEIEGFEKREDAIIYEIHVRDFTSDPALEDELEHQFGTFMAFTEKLDYIEELGVTHVQLLPVMSYYFGDELANAERMLEYSTSNNNYNWGYDPHSYFSVSGMYSEDPTDPELRIKELKTLIDEIHNRGMGVILDVVYNHTARVHIFEDLVPYYYHFMDADGTTRTSFGGGRLGTTHEMSRRILVDSITYWVEEYKVDGFRFDMMGDHDAESIEMAYEKAKELNPDILMIGEGWRTYVGDELEEDVMPADQDWMEHTETVGVFSDDFRDELKSGFGFEGEPRFITGAPRDIEHIFDNIRAQPHNFVATAPGDAVQYISAHDNLTLHDVISKSIQKDPDYHQEEIQKRIRLGNTMVLTAQGTSFLHAGQEYGRTKQFRAETEEQPPDTQIGVDEEGEKFAYPYFVDDSYDSTDAVNMFDWSRVREEGVHRDTREFTRGLIELRRSTEAFRLENMELIEAKVDLVDSPDIAEEDLAIGYRAESPAGEVYYVFINADEEAREFELDVDLAGADILVDAERAGTEALTDPVGVELTDDGLLLEALTPAVFRVE